jgi:peptidyl-prolyl cis-trans isomerase C
MLPLMLLLLTAAEPPAVAATVNGESIPLSRVDGAIRKLAILPASTNEHRRLRTEVLDDLIDDVLLKQFLDKNAPKVEAAEIDKMMAAFTASLERKGQSLAKFLKESNQSEAELRASWSLTAQLDAYIHKTVSDDELKKYWSEHRDHFDRTETKASHILLRPGQKATAVELAAAKEKLEAIQKDVAAGKVTFAAAAKKHSLCPSASNGGDLGWFPRTGAMVEEFAKPAFKLKPGEMAIVQTEFGLHLVLVTDRKAGKPSMFEKCIDEVREVYADEQRTALPRTLRKDAAIKITLP